MSSKCNAVIHDLQNEARTGTKAKMLIVCRSNYSVGRLKVRAAVQTIGPLPTPVAQPCFLLLQQWLHLFSLIIPVDIKLSLQAGGYIV